MTLLWSVFTDGNRETLARSFYVCGLECWSWDDTKSTAGADVCLASSFTNRATDMSSRAVTLSWVALSTFNLNLVICTRSLDVHALRFFPLEVRSVDGDHIGPTLNKKHVIQLWLTSKTKCKSNNMESDYLFSWPNSW